MLMLHGVFTALVTPFQNGKLDLDALKRNVDFQLENGVAGLVPCGTTGETPTLSHQEDEVVITTVIKHVRGRVPVIAGAGSNSTETAVKKTVFAKNAGADAVLIVTPYYNKPTQEGIFQHFRAIVQAVDIPVVVYNIAGRTGVNISTPTLERIAGLPHLAAVKEASGSMAQIMEVCHLLRDRISVLSGDDSMTLPLMSVGGVGVVSVLSNLFPGEMVQMVNMALQGNFQAARGLHDKLFPAMNAIFVETNPVPIKYAMFKKGLIPCCEVRSPLVELAVDSRAKVDRIL